MRSKGVISVLIVVFVAVFIWMAQEAAGQLLVGGKKEWLAWRADHANTVLIIWAGVTVVVLIVLLATVGRRMLKAFDEQQRAAAEAKGVGRIFLRALRGDERAADKLVLLLKDQSKAVRLQSARALAVLDDEDVNPTLLRIVRYWPGNDKLELIDVLRKENDIRVGKVLKEFTHDRNPMVARKALTALAIVGHVSKGVTKDEDERRRGRVKRARKPSRPEVTAGDAAALARPGASSVAEVTGRAGKSGEGEAIAVSASSTRDRRSPRRTTSASPAEPTSAQRPASAAGSGAVTPGRRERAGRPAAPRPGTKAANDAGTAPRRSAKRSSARDGSASRQPAEVPGSEAREGASHAES